MSEGKKSNAWIWVVVILIIALLALFFMFRGGKEETGTGGQQTGTGGQQPSGQEQPTPTTSGDEISNLDVGDNPDIGVDDLNSLPASQEEITG